MKQQLSKHRTIGAALAVACSAVMAFTVSAETAGGVTLNLSTDKTSYTSGERVNVSVSVRNDNDYAINNVSVASTLPSGFTISGNSSSTISAGTIAAGDGFDGSYSISMSTGGTPVTPSKPNPNPSPKPNPIIPAASENDSADNKADEDDKNVEDVSSGAGVFDDSESIRFSGVNTGKFAVVFLLTLAAVYGIAMLIKHKKGLKKFLSLFMAVGIIIPFCAEWGTIDISAESGTVSASAAFTYGGVQYSVSANAAYEYDVNEEDIDALSLELAARYVRVMYQKGDNKNSVTQNITLATDISDFVSDIADTSGLTVSWQSYNSDIISSSGFVSRPVGTDTQVGLKAVVSDGEHSVERDFTVNVIGQRTRDISSIQEVSIDDIMKIDPDIYIRADDENEYVLSMIGQFSNINVKNIDDAQDAAQSICSLVGLENAYTELVPLVVNRSEYSSGYSFSQIYSGYEVYGLGLTVCADTNGTVSSMSAGVCPTAALNGVNIYPAISGRDAESIAQANYSNCKADSSKTELVIYALDSYADNPVLAYVVNVSGEGVDNDVLINAQTGELITSIPNILNAITTVEPMTGEGVDEMGNTVTFPVLYKHVDRNYYLRDDIRGIIPMEYSMVTVLRRDIKNEKNEWTDPTVISAYTNMISVYDWYLKKLKRESYDGEGTAFNIYAHYKERENNAAWGGGSMFFGDTTEPEKSSMTMASCLDIVGHEYTHGVFGSVAPAVVGGSFAAGAINEGYADIFGALIDGDWQFGDSYCNGVSRDSANPSSILIGTLSDGVEVRYPDHMDDYFGGYFYKDGEPVLYDDGGVHINSTIISHCAYLMTARYGISSDTLAKLWYNSMDNGYTAGSDFYTVRDNVVAAAYELSLSDETITNIKAAFDDVGIYEKRVHVKIVDSETKEPIEGADVTIGHSSLKNPNGISGESDSDGMCLIPFPIETTVDINVSAEGYKEYSSTAESKLAPASEFETIELVKSDLEVVSIKIDETKSTELQRVYPLNTTHVNREGGYLRVTYEDGSEKSVDLTNIGVYIDPIDGTTPGPKDLTVTYMEKSCILTVIVEDSQVEDFEINDPNIEYYIGDDFQREKWSITVTYIDNASESETISLADDSTITVSGFDSSTAGVKTVSITYSGITKTVDVTVNENKEILDIDIRRHPAKAFYSLGEELDLTGGQISVIYTDGTSEEIDMSSAAVTGFDSSTEGCKHLTVTYRGKQAYFDVWVAADLHTPYQIYFASNWDTIDNLYSINETLTDDDVKDAQITVAHMDGYTEKVPLTADMIEGFDTTTSGVHSCKIVYNGMYMDYYYAVRPPVEDDGSLLGGIVANSKPVTSAGVYRGGKTKYAVDEEFDNTGFQYILSHGNNPLYDTFDITECSVVSFQSRFPGTYVAQVVVYDYEHTLSNYVVNIKITVQ